MAPEYDETLIVEYADRLYRAATLIVALWTIGGALIGLILGFMSHSFAANSGSDDDSGIVGAGMGGVVGYLIGQAKAFWYRLQAQTALCQAQIERNTRAAADERFFTAASLRSSSAATPPASLGVSQGATKGPRFCSECGSRIDLGDAACRACGTTFTQPEATDER